MTRKRKSLEKDLAAQVLARKRLRKMTDKQRSEMARKMARARWDKPA